MLLNLWKTCSCFLGRARSSMSGNAHSASQLRRQRHNWGAQVSCSWGFYRRYRRYLLQFQRVQHQALM